MRTLLPIFITATLIGCPHPLETLPSDSGPDSALPDTDSDTDSDPPECTVDSDCTAPETCAGAGAAGECGDQAGPVYLIPHSTLADHGDASTPHTLAWRLRFVGPGHTVRLSSAASYTTNTLITLPDGVTLEGVSGATLIGGAGVFNSRVLGVGQHTTVRDLVLDGGRQASHVLSADGTSGVHLHDLTIRNTRNDFPSGASAHCHGVLARNTTNILVERVTIENIGYPKQNPQVWGGVCAGIYALHSVGMTVRDSTIRTTLTAGIDFTASTGTLLEDNLIQRTGRNIEYWLTDYDLPVADGITAYSNDSGFTYQDITIRRNVVEDSGNHGIHMSGRDVHIHNNTVRRPLAQGIIIDDHRPPADCASNVTVQNNTVEGLLSGGNRHAVYIGRDHKPGAVSVVGTMPNDVYWRPNAECQ